MGLLIALARRPELLLLDEPSSGLDPIVRRDILGAVIRTIAEEGRTVLFSSHLMDEVEQVADHVTLISRGRIVLSATLEAIRESHRTDGRVPSLEEIFVAHVGAPTSGPPAEHVGHALAGRRYRLGIPPAPSLGPDRARRLPGHRGDDQAADPSELDLHHG